MFLEWQSLDNRTKSNETSTMSNLLNAFTNPSIEGLLTKRKHRLDLDGLIEGGNRGSKLSCLR